MPKWDIKIIKLSDETIYPPIPSLHPFNASNQQQRNNDMDCKAPRFRNL